MRILIVKPETRLVATNGNKVTSDRLERLFSTFGHDVVVSEVACDQGNLPDVAQPDLLVALHARHSGAAVQHYASLAVPVVLVLTGTDIYRDLAASDPIVCSSLEAATVLVALQDQAPLALPSPLRRKCHVIYQACEPLTIKPQTTSSYFELAQVGHLREEKDPLRGAYAVRTLSDDSRIRLIHVGECLSDEWIRSVEKELRVNRRYVPVGALDTKATRNLIARSRGLVSTSRMEGAGNVVAEAIADGVPVLASRVAGSIGMLGEDYDGFFDTGDTSSLRRLMQRFEGDSNFRATLRAQVVARQWLLDAERERAAWSQLLEQVTVKRG